MSLQRVSADEYDAIIGALRGGAPDAEEYQRLSTVVLDVPGAAALQDLNPFSAAYREAVLGLYLALRGRSGDYEAGRDEFTELGPIANLFADVVPWNFKDPRLVADFLLAWSQILRLIDLAGGQRASVLEYGPGTGQILLTLARLGYRACGVDIDVGSIDLVRRQAAAMGLAVETDQAGFGDGFGHQRFDRILFFESFHHAADPIALLRRLRRRLKPGGRLILAGEPVVDVEGDGIPYPWGPRLDGLSVFCIRRYGWMELGFSRAFLLDAMRRTGWEAEAHPYPGSGRAAVFVATAVDDGERGPTVALAPDSDACAWGEGWYPPEGAHRWTDGPARLTLPPDAVGAHVALRVTSFLPVAKRVSARCGDVVETLVLAPGEVDRELYLPDVREREVVLECEGHRPIDVIAGSNDPRPLGVALLGIELEPSALPVA